MNQKGFATFMKTERGFAPIYLLIGVLILGGVVVGAFYFINLKTYHTPLLQEITAPSTLQPTPKSHETTQTFKIDEKIIQEKITGDYQWEDTTMQGLYSNVLWNKIITPKLSGFSPKMNLIEKSDRAEFGHNYLRSEGGIIGVGFWLEDSNANKIDSLEKLINKFAPIDNESEAASFLSVTQKGLKIDESGIPDGHVLTINDGFLVQLVKKNTFGCGPHSPTGVIFKINKSGDIQEIAHEKEKPIARPSDGSISPTICVD